MVGDKNMKCYSYVRFSSKEQAFGRSYNRQMEKAREFAAEQGWELDESLCMYDPGFSAFHSDHKTKGKLGVFLKAVEEGKIPIPSALIIENLDRLSREAVLPALQQFLGLLNAGITIVTHMDRQIYNKESVSENYFQLLISISIMARSHDESKVKQFRRTDVWNKAKINARRGEKIKARCVAWLTLNKKTLKFEFNEHVETVKRIYQLYLDGHGLTSICKILNTEKVSTFHKGTKGWGTTSVKRILTTKSVLGEIQFTKTSSVENGKRIMVIDGEPVKNYYPPIIDEDTFYEAQRIQNIKYRAFGKVGEMQNLFSKIAKCGYCGATMRYNVRGRNNIKYLSCSASRKNYCDVPTFISFRYSDLEEAFLRLCAQLRLEDIIYDDHDEQKKQIEFSRKEATVIEQKIKESKEKLENLGKSLASGDGSKETNEFLINLINNETFFQKNSWNSLKELKKKVLALESLRKSSRDSLEILQSVIKKLNDNDETIRFNIRQKLRKHILELVESIVIYPGGKAYKELMDNLDELNEKSAKNLLKKNYMNKYREVDIHFRGGGVLSLTHDFSNGKLKFLSEKTSEGKFTKKTLNTINDHPNIKSHILELIKKDFEN